MYRKYYSYNDMPKPVLHEQTRQLTPQPEPRNLSKPPSNNGTKVFFKNLETDDLLLIAVLLILFLDDCEDKMLIAAVAFLLLSDN